MVKGDVIIGKLNKLTKLIEEIRDAKKPDATCELSGSARIALEFYANPVNWVSQNADYVSSYVSKVSSISKDGGALARCLLARIDKEQP